MTPSDKTDLKALAIIVVAVCVLIGGIAWASTAISYSYVWTCDTTRIADGWRTNCGWQ